MPDIIDLVEHIIKTPNIKHPANHFTIGVHPSEYGDTSIRPKAKEHKLWTPCNDRRHRCFLIIQLVANSLRILRIHHVLDDAEKWLKTRSYTSLTFSQPQTYAAERGAKDQFKGAIEISLSDISDEEAILKKGLEIKQLIIDITNETVMRGQNLRLRRESRVKSLS